MIFNSPQKQFNKRTVRSFAKVKNDLTSFKDNTHEWISFLQKQQELLMKKIEQLESQLEKLNKTGKKKVIA